MWWVAGLLALGIGLTGCSTTQPVAIIGQKGEVLKGSTTASLFTGGSFEASGGGITCAGNYDAYTYSRTVSFKVTCSDGRKGLGTAVRDASGQSGSGTIRMNDGSDWNFVFGPAAEAF